MIGRAFRPSPRRVGLAILIVASLVVFGLVERWQPAGAQLLRNAELQADDRGLPAGWKVSGRDGGVRVVKGTLSMSKPAIPEVVGIDQVVQLPPGQRAYRVEAVFACQDVRAAADAPPWQAAWISFAGRLADGTVDNSRPGYLVRALGTQPARAYSAVIELAPEVEAGILRVRLARVSGTMQVSGLSVVPVAPRPEYRIPALGLLAIWAAVGALAAGRMVRASRHRAAAVGLVIALAAALALSLLPQDAAAPAYDLLRAPFRGLVDRDQIDLAVHALGFALVAVLWRLARPEGDVRLYFALLVVLAVGGELLQGLTTGLASDDIADAAANLLGVALGAAAVSLVVRRRTRAG